MCLAAIMKRYMPYACGKYLKINLIKMHKYGTEDRRSL